MYQRDKKGRELMEKHSRVYAEIDLDAIRYNMEQMKQRVGADAQFIAVVKTDGYGHGAIPIAQMLEKDPSVWGYATATLEEAVDLHHAGIQKPTIVLGCVFPDQYETMIREEVRATVYTMEMAKEMSEMAERLGKDAYFHIKIDTGMERLGFPVTEESADIIAEIEKLPHVKLEGMFTHFAKADEKDKTFSEKQYEKFLWMKEAVEQRGVQISRFHCDNSAGIIDFPQWRQDLVRAGISLYGMYPSDEVEKDTVQLKPALRLVSHVSFVKEVAKGVSISYGGTFTAEKNLKVATIPVGYGDGYARGLSNQADVLIHGKRARILGRVCMDQFMVDVTDIPDVKFMDEVVLIGKSGEEEITVEELSELSGRFNYEFVCCLGKRIPRVYKGGNL